MKRKYFAVILICFCLLFSGCVQRYVRICSRCFAEVRYNYFTAKTEEFFIDFMSGKREKEYVLNGKSTPLVDFGVVTIEKLLEAENIELTNVVIFVNGIQYETQLLKSPFDNKYVADIGRTVKNTDEIRVMILGLNIEQPIVLENNNRDWICDHNTALELMIEHFKPTIKSMIVNGEFYGEIYIKIVISEEGKYPFWFVNVLGQKGENFGIYIDPIILEIIEK